MNNNNLEQITELISKVMHENYPVEDSISNDVLTTVDKLMQYVDDSYVEIMWPEIQKYMDEPWFDNEVLVDTYGDSTRYAIPIKRLI